MTDPRGTILRALRALVTALQPLNTMLADTTSASAFLVELGVRSPTVPQSLLQLRTLVQQLSTALTVVEGFLASGDEVSPQALEKIGDLGDAAAGIFGALNTLPSQIETDLAAYPDLLAEVDASELVERLSSRLLIEYLRQTRPAVYNALVLLGPIEVRDVEAGEEYVPAYTHYAIRTDRVRLWFTDPQAALQDVYGWGSAAFDHRTLLVRLQYLLMSLGYLGTLGRLGALVVADADAPAGDVELHLPVFSAISEVGGVGVDAIIRPTIPPDATDTGLLLTMGATGQVATTIDLSPSTRLTLGGDFAATGGIGVELRPPLRVVPVTGAAAGSGAAARVKAELIVRPADGNRIALLEQPGLLVLDIAGVSTGIAVDVRTGADPVLQIEARLLEGLLSIGGGDADGFLQKILPPDGIRASFELGVGWRTDSGLYFVGSGGFEIAIPVSIDLFGILKITAIGVKVKVSNEGADGAITCNASASIGPVSAAVEGIGAAVRVQPKDQGGNLGPLDASIGFKPPTGAGLAVDAGAIIGGGYVEFNNDEKRYAGILQLNFGEIGLVAIGLITTRLPDGSKGFSMLIIIAVEFSPAIQLSFGFTLSGVGGLLGIHRTMLVDVLREGLKQRTLDSILFPQNPILNAPKIISDLRAVFPPEQGRFVLGPMVKLGWGSPTIITADLGILIELPDPVRVVLLGQLEAKLPESDDAIVVLHVDVLGVIEFAKKSLAIDATIYDSRILTYGLSGDGAVRLTWGDNPKFAMSLGGFHPRFSPPPAFPDLRRLKLELSSSSSFQLSCKVYQALTSNSLQFGAKLELYAESGGASVDGELGFDTLIYFSPFSFEVDIYGKVVARYKGRKLAGISLSLTLSGPTPWRAKGSATFEILCWDVKVRFDKRWGRDDPAVLASVDPWTPLREALQRPACWSATLPPNVTMVERLKELQAPAGTVFVHPAGTLEVRQKVLPLGLKLDKFGNAPVKTHHTFRIDRIEAGQGSVFDVLNTEPLEDYFARGQYEDLSNDRRLSLPSFEKLQAGVTARSGSVRLNGAVEEFTLEYESIVIDGDETARRPTETDEAGNTRLILGSLPWEMGKRLVKGAAAKRAASRNGGFARDKVNGKNGKTQVGEDGYVIVDADDLTPIGEDVIAGNDGTMTRVEADRAREAYVAEHPEEDADVLVVAAFESVS